MQLDNKSKIFIISFFSIILIPVLIIGLINYTKDQKSENKVENSKTTRTLSLNNISTKITMEDLLNMEPSKEYTIEDNELKYENDENKKDFTITYTNSSYFGSNCIKEYFFVDEYLKIVIFTIDTSHWMPKDIYEELVKINGDPDIINLKTERLGRDSYTWYGSNGTIILNDDNISNTIEIIFQLLGYEVDDN